MWWTKCLSSHIGIIVSTAIDQSTAVVKRAFEKCIEYVHARMELFIFATD